MTFLQYYFPILVKILRVLVSSPQNLARPIHIIKQIRKYLELSHISEINPKELIEKIEKEDSTFKLIDIRNDEDFNSEKGHIKGAISIPLIELIDDLNIIKKYKNKELILVCEIGRTSKFTVHLLSHHGYNNLKNLVGGMKSWIEKGYPIIKEKNRKIHQKAST